MSRHYTCDIYLDVEFSENNLLFLMKNGKKMGFVYLGIQSYCDDIYTAPEMSPEGAKNHIITGKTIEKNNYDFPSGLTIRIEEAFFTLYFNEEDNVLKLHFFSLENPWYKYFNDERCFDFGRVVRLLIDLCDDFPIIKIETNIDY